MHLSSFFNLKYQGKILWIILAFFSIFMFFPQPGVALEKKITNPIGISFILVEPGAFMMGSPKTEPFRDSDEHQRLVKIKTPYYMQTTEVTLKQWWAIMGKKWFFRRKGPENMPVTLVSYYDCLKFIHKLNQKKMGVYRLPTEMEWEYACRAGTTTAYYWGDTIDCSRAMYGNCARKNGECTIFFTSLNITVDRPAPVKSFAPNPWGLYDMSGNLWEWCADKYTPHPSHPYDETYNPLDSESRVRRGGSWFRGGQYLRSANRTYAHPGAKFHTTGFRLVRETD
ncbi:MAG: formylglycine-generating enzyme family protein [Desulfobacteraceae bacterium]|nr:formylglycine-generating enzyme family protein [Desulfobacteraceae bacterium]